MPKQLRQMSLSELEAMKRDYENKVAKFNDHGSAMMLVRIKLEIESVKKYGQMGKAKDAVPLLDASPSQSGDAVAPVGAVPKR